MYFRRELQQEGAAALVRLCEHFCVFACIWRQRSVFVAVQGATDEAPKGGVQVPRRRSTPKGALPSKKSLTAGGGGLFLWQACSWWRMRSWL